MWRFIIKKVLNLKYKISCMQRWTLSDCSFFNKRQTARYFCLYLTFDYHRGYILFEKCYNSIWNGFGERNEKLSCISTPRQHVLMQCYMEKQATVSCLSGNFHKIYIVEEV